MLISALEEADRIKMNADARDAAAKGTQQHCPKTLSDLNLTRDHQQLVTHQVANWLEKIYEPSQDLDIIGQRQPRQPQRGGSVDFEHVSDLIYELTVLQAIFDALRAGQLSKIMEFLETSQNCQQYLWLVGNIPFFDNFKYK